MPHEFEIVSHPRMKYVTAFVVSVEQRLTHIHRELELGYILSGSLALRTQTRTVPLKAGDLYLVNPMEPHEFLSEPGGAMIAAVQLAPRVADGFLSAETHFWYAGDPNLRAALAEDHGAFETICSAFLDLVWRYLRQSEKDEFRCFGLCASLVCCLHLRLPWRTLDPAIYASMSQRSNRMIAITDYIDLNFQRKLLLGEIAQREGMSLSYLSHFFKDVLGMTFQEYLNRKRLEYACQLMVTTDRRLMDISLSSGFSDVRYFTAAFKSRFGCTPKEYRSGGAITAQRKSAQGDIQYFPSDQGALELVAAKRREFRERTSVPNAAALFE